MSQTNLATYSVTNQHEIPIACMLTALSREQRKREGALLAEHHASFKEIRERGDGYSFHYPPDAGLFARMAELVSLEHLCCPFLNFQLEWSGTATDPWLHITGGERVKEFVLQTFGRVG